MAVRGGGCYYYQEGISLIINERGTYAVSHPTGEFSEEMMRMTQTKTRPDQHHRHHHHHMLQALPRIRERHAQKSCERLVGREDVWFSTSDPRRRMIMGGWNGWDRG